MVRVAGKNCVLDAGGGQKSPPLPFIEVDEETARALVGTGVARLVGEDDARAAEWAAAETEASEAAQAELAASVTEPELDADDAQADEAPGDASDIDRRQAIVDAFDLLEPEHFVKTGARKGFPKLNAMEDITEIRDLTVAEIDELFAARDDAADA